MNNDFDFRYPVGKLEEQVFSKKENYEENQKLLYIKAIEECPANLKSAVANLSDEQINTFYRNGGWTVR